jgi:hypothetical protein
MITCGEILSLRVADKLQNVVLRKILTIFRRVMIFVAGFGLVYMKRGWGFYHPTPSWVSEDCSESVVRTAGNGSYQVK